MDFTGPKSRGRQGCAPKQALGESLFPCLFHLQEAAFIPWLMASSFIFKDRSLAPLNLSDYDTLLSRLHFLLLTLILPPPSYKDPCDYTGLSSIIQDNLPISRSQSSHICKVPFTMEGNKFTSTWDQDMNTFGGPLFSSPWQGSGRAHGTRNSIAVISGKCNLPQLNDFSGCMVFSV